jgi:uncharacterized protein DUF1566
MKLLRSSLIITAVVAAFALPAAADSLASWDTVIIGAARFKVLTTFNNAAVLDHETGLVWERSPDLGTRSWFVAHRFCIDRAVGNGTRKGWRLPTVQELLTLVDPTRTPPSLPAGHPFLNVQPDFYWAATTFGENPALAWGAGFENDLTEPGARFTDKNLLHLVWCVRSGHPGPDVQ